MGNNGFKRVLAIVLAATCMLVFSFSATFAASSSPKSGTHDGTKDSTYSFSIPANSDTGTAALEKVYKKSVKSKTVYSTFSHDGATCKITTIKKNAFKGTKATKVKITISGKKRKASAFSFSKGAFNGLSKKSSIVVSKSTMTKKEFNKLKKKLQKAGFKGKITRK